MSTRTLIWGSGSGPCWRVQIALHEKALKYDSRLISFSEKGHKTPETFALNPRGQVPILKDGDVVVNESLAAIQYLEETYPEPSLVPKGSSAQVLQRLHESNNVLVALRGISIARGNKASEEEIAGKTQDLKKELGYWESYLGSSAYIAGSQFSLADAAVIPNFLAIERGGGDFSQSFPNLKKYVDTVKQRSSVAESWPPHWKETPNQSIIKL